MQMITTRVRNARTRLAVAATLMAIASLPMFPGTAVAGTEYKYHKSGYIYTCPPSGNPNYQCDRAAYGTEAWITATDSSGTYTAAKVEFHPYGEHLYVHDNYTNTRYAWAHVQRQTSEGWKDYKVRSGYYVHKNYDWPEEQSVRVRACEGTYSVFDAYGCTPWSYAKS